jgi:hypothetical protein
MLIGQAGMGLFSVLLWQGTGHGAAIYSACALPPVITYLQSGQLPDSDIYCPA